MVGLVVTIGPEDDETIIAGARYSCSETHGVCHEAEVAFTVQPEYQGQGIASVLLQRLASIARERGIIQFKAETLTTNQAMLTVFSRSGLPMQTTTERGIIYVTMMLNGNQA